MMWRPEEINKQQHRTMFYNSNRLIVRRGQEFQVKLTFNRPYKPKEDKFALEFVIGRLTRPLPFVQLARGGAEQPVVCPGADPDYSKGTYIPVFPNKEQQPRWAGRITDASNNIVTMGITALGNCIVGKYHMYIAVMTPFGIRRTRNDPERDLYILFNPWSPGWSKILFSFFLFFLTELVRFAVTTPPFVAHRSPADDVFLDDELERQECVMNELGIIYHGAYDDVAERQWNYGQVIVTRKEKVDHLLSK